jgi:hypothetical protein
MINRAFGPEKHALNIADNFVGAFSFLRRKQGKVRFVRTGQ